MMVMFNNWFTEFIKTEPSTLMRWCKLAPTFQ